MIQQSERVTIVMMNIDTKKTTTSESRSISRLRIGEKKVHLNMFEIERRRDKR